MYELFYAKNFKPIQYFSTVGATDVILFIFLYSNQISNIGPYHTLSTINLTQKMAVVVHTKNPAMEQELSVAHTPSIIWKATSGLWNIKPDRRDLQLLFEPTSLVLITVLRLMSSLSQLHQKLEDLL